MDDTLRIIRYLYDEEEQPEEVERRLAANDELRAEYEALHAVKKQLDRRPRQRPNAEVLDRITEAAGSGRTFSEEETESRHERRQDREPARPSRSLRRRQWAGAAAAAALVLIIVAVGLWQYPSALSEEGIESTPLATEQSDVAQQAPEQRVTETRHGELPAWDEAEDVVRLHRHIETLQARSRPGSWNAGTLPLQQASQTRPAN